MRRLVLCASIVMALGVISAHAQAASCPDGLVCISPDAARKALQDSDTVKAQSAEIVVKDIAISDLQKELNNLRIELAKITGEKTGSDQMVVRLTAILDIVIKNTRKKSIGLIAF